MNDLHDSDLESDASSDACEEFAPTLSNVAMDVVTTVPSYAKKVPIPDFCIALGLWCEKVKEGIKRTTYGRLLEVLLLSDHGYIHSLETQLVSKNAAQEKEISIEKRENNVILA